MRISDWSSDVCSSDLDFGRFATTLAAFQITQPSGFTDPITNVFSVDGEQRNRGLELNVFGELRDDFRILGGLAYTRGELTKTRVGVNEGRAEGRSVGTECVSKCRTRWSEIL